jgi:hypothetical protein
MDAPIEGSNNIFKMNSLGEGSDGAKPWPDLRNYAARLGKFIGEDTRLYMTASDPAFRRTGSH